MTDGMHRAGSGGPRQPHRRIGSHAAAARAITARAADSLAAPAHRAMPAVR